MSHSLLTSLDIGLVSGGSLRRGRGVRRRHSTVQLSAEKENQRAPHVHSMSSGEAWTEVFLLGLREAPEQQAKLRAESRAKSRARMEKRIARLREKSDVAEILTIIGLLLAYSWSKQAHAHVYTQWSLYAAAVTLFVVTFYDDIVYHLTGGDG